MTTKWRVQITLIIILVLTSSIYFTAVMTQGVKGYTQTDECPNLFELTATYIVGQATSQASESIGLLSAIEMTVTRVIDLANYQANCLQSSPASQNIPTSPPCVTLTSSELSSASENYLQQLVSSAGFDHPIFEEVTEQYRQRILELQYWSGCAWDYPVVVFSPEVERVVFGGSEYVAMIVQYAPFFGSGSDQFRLFLFRIDRSPLLLEDPTANSFNGHVLSYYSGGNSFFGTVGAEYLGGFSDRNANGQPDLAVIGLSGTATIQQLFLLELQADGSFADIAPTWRNFYAVALDDVNGDSASEIVVIGCETHPLQRTACPVIERYYQWDGSKYRNISDRLNILTHHRSINDAKKFIRQQQGCVIPNAIIYEMFIAYEVRDQLSQAWRMWQPEITGETCSDENSELFASRMRELEAWVEYRLESAELG
jgi:hypothetical protein